MKWPRKQADWLINYIADRFYDRLHDRLLEDLAPWATRRAIRWRVGDAGGKGLRGDTYNLSAKTLHDLTLHDFLGGPQ
ncbi:hypothetical protein PROPHIGD89-1_52 [Mycobacterium phage prophi89-1]|uniref:hypothetical protein n=1 Tax=Mycobacteroides abscessus TaxID=36809 RepID=UPI0019388FD0|nr:hypothetical protein [Mycobacteroides abscessus]MBN7473144.1 hypothetical protein [Mycobacteroides abscessus subsp. abscessus]QPO17203.1 hypothetical protein PHIGD89-1_28 [Mycobacterium phage phiGD89-1]QST90263.1 hypothetical protein PROPHIGD89-1_52 [Mycobacterium phage prophi89-1]